jgi:hypothetical protein
MPFDLRPPFDNEISAVSLLTQRRGLFLFCCPLCQHELCLLILSLTAWAFARVLENRGRQLMAWDVTAYGIAFAVTAIAAACVWGIVEACRSLRRMAASAERLSRETEAALTECRQLAEETAAAVRVGRRNIEGFAALAEGARVLGEAAQTAAHTVSHVAGIWKERAGSHIAAGTECQDQEGHKPQDWVQLGRTLWQFWKKRSDGPGHTDCFPNSGQSADPSQGE